MSKTREVEIDRELEEEKKAEYIKHDIYVPSTQIHRPRMYYVAYSPHRLSLRVKLSNLLDLVPKYRGMTIWQNRAGSMMTKE